MTQLIDINLEKYSTNYLKNNPYNHPTKSSPVYFDNQLEEPKGLKEQQWSFIYETELKEFNFLFSISMISSSFNINIYLLNKNLQIHKIQTYSERNLLINSFLKHKYSYQPNIDPSTGFIYFKVSYFHYKEWKGGGKNHIKNPSKDILKFFDIEKLMQSAQKLSEFGLKMEDEHLTSSVWNDEKSYLQLSKFVSQLTEKNDLQSILITKNNEEKNNQSIKAANKKFVQSIIHFSSANPPHKHFISPIRLQNFLTSLSHDYNQLSSLVKIKTGRSNYDSILINQSTTKKLNELMTSLLYRRESSKKEIFKVLEGDLGKITLEVEREDDKKFLKKTSLLQLLPKHTEYHFLDKYFRSGINIPIMLRLSLKDESLAKYLENNKKTISLETKMRLMLQLYSAVTTMWEENKILLYVNKFENVFVTKNLTVKLRGLESWYRPEPHVLVEEKHEINNKIIENLMNLTKFYYKIFHEHTLIYVRPSSYQSNVELNLLEFSRSKRSLENLRHPSITQEGFNGKGLKQLLTGLGYVFNEHLELARKVIENEKKKASEIEKYVVINNENDEIEQNKQKETSSIISEKLLNLKHTCSWLFKILEAITKEIE